MPLTELTQRDSGFSSRTPEESDDLPLALVPDAASALLAVRGGRIGFFAHDLQPGLDLPPVVRKWLDHERTILAAASPRTVDAGRPSDDRLAGSPWIVWRLLSGNNREIGRGVGVHDSLTAARRAVERAVVNADRFTSTYVFDRRSSHGWCLHLDGVPIMVSPLWHRSRRVNRLNLDTVRLTLGRAEVNAVATQLGGSTRNRGVSLQ